MFFHSLFGKIVLALCVSLWCLPAVGASFATIWVSGIAALAPLAIVLRPFGLSHEVALPLMIIVDPLADMVRTMLNLELNCMSPALAAGPAAAEKI